MKNEINISNYKKFWDNYLNGHLSEDDEIALMNFLENNPELSVELDEDESLKLSPDSDVVYKEKDNLKSENQIENLIISKIENTIDSESEAYLNEKIDNDDQTKELYDLYNNTKLKADTAITYPYKNKLRRTKILPIYRYVSSAAAILILAFVAGTFIFNSQAVKEVENVHFSDLKIDARTPIEVPDTSVDYSSDSEITQESTDISFEKEHEIEPQIERLDIPVRMASAQLREISYSPEFAQASFDKRELTSFYYQPKTDDEQLNFTLEYSKSQSDNRLISSVNKIFEAGRDINISKSINELREKRSELLISSIK